MEVKYDTIGTGYNETRKADPYLTGQLLKHLNPNTEGTYLDIGCGTGNYTNEFQKQGFNFIGIDPSKKMLDTAKSKNAEIDWRIRTAENSGLKSESVDGIIGSLTIHHWTDLGAAFQELYRVMKPKGKIVIFTSTPKQMKGYWLYRYFPKMLEDSINQMPALENIFKSMVQSGFEISNTENYSIRPDLKDLFLYCGKQNPEIYFQKEVKNGISSFSALANLEEVNAGLKKLKLDIDTGKIDKIINSFENDLGDYLFVIGKKPAHLNA